MNLKLLNSISSFLSFLMIIIFQIASLGSELFGDFYIIASVKRSILHTLPLLIILMILAAVSAKKHATLYPNNKYSQIKIKRMKLMGINGLIFLAPLAITLNFLAENSMISTLFYSLQFLEITCGLVNIFLFIRIFIDYKKCYSL